MAQHDPQHHRRSGSTPGDSTRRDGKSIRIDEHTVIDRATLVTVAQKHHVRSMLLFGSAARGERTPQSDIDILVEFEPGASPSLGTMVHLQDALSAAFGGHRVDVATTSILRNPYRRRVIEQEARTLYAVT